MNAELADQLRARLQVTPAKVSEAVRRIVDAGAPVRVVAFGSRARGDANADSDLDLAVVLDKVDRSLRSKVGSQLLLDIDLDIDLLVTDVAHFETFSKFESSVHHDILCEGVTLYERGRDAVENADAIAHIC